MTLSTDNLKSACSLSIIIKLNISTTACHIGSNCNLTLSTGLSYNLRLKLMELRIQNLMLYAPLTKHCRQLLTGFNCNSTNQYRLSLGMCLNNSIHNGIELLLLSLIYGILMIDSGNRLIGRNLNYIHAVNISELLLLSKSSTGHAGLLLKLIEEVLESDSRKSLAFPLNLHMLLGLNCLMESVRITTAGHNTTRELINNKHLVILNNIVLVSEHQIMSSECQNNIMLDLDILRVSQVFNMEKLLDFSYTALGKIEILVLLVDNKVTRLFSLNTHDGVHLA